MSKLGKIISALVLGLVLSVSLAVTGVFAQSANPHPHTTSNVAPVAATTAASPSTSATVSHPNAQPVSWTYRGYGGFNRYRGFNRGYHSYGGYPFYGYRGYGYRGYGSWGY
jgi:hypothetical protein